MFLDLASAGDAARPASVQLSLDLALPPIEGAAADPLARAGLSSVAAVVAADGPRAAIADLLTRLDGRTLHPEELAAAAGVSRREADAICAAIAELSGDGRRPPVRVPNGSRPADPERVRGMLPQALGGMQGTMLDPDCGGLLEQLDVATVERIGMIGDPHLLVSALCDVLLHRRHEPEACPLAVVSAWEALDEVRAVSGWSPSDARSGGRIMRRYAEGTLCPDHAPALRRRALGRISAFRNAVRAYAPDFPEDAAATFAATAPAPVLSGADLDAVANFRRRHALGCRRNRKLSARGLTRALDPALAAAAARVRETRELHDACDAAERIMRQDGLAGWLGFGFDCAVAACGNGLGARDVTVRLRAHWRREFEAALSAGGLSQGALDLRDDCARPVAPFDTTVEPVVFEIVAVELMDADPDGFDGDAGGVPEPLVIRLSRLGVSLPASGLSPAALVARVDAIVELGLPFPRYRPAGLIAPDDPADARLHQRALDAGRPLVSPAPWLHGLLLAFACALVMVESLARNGEVRQMVHAEEGWTVVGEGRFSADAFLAVPKAQKLPQAFRIGPMAFEAVIDVVAFAMRRDGLDETPVVAPARDLARRCAEGRYVFAVRGRALAVADLNYLLAILFAGVARVRTHDLRHAAAVRARREGATDEDIASWMRVAGGCVDHYASDPDDDAADEADDDGGAEAFLRQLDHFAARADARVMLRADFS